MVDPGSGWPGGRLAARRRYALLMHTPHRRTTALASLALVLAPVLSSCGFDYATDREYTPAVGANNRDGMVDVLGSAVVTAETGESVFIAGLANNSTDQDVSLEGVSSPDGLTFSGIEDIDLAPLGFINLAESESPVIVEGDLEAGRYVEVAVDFSTGETVDLKVPVVENCGEFASVSGVPTGPDVCEVNTGEDH